MRTPLAPVNVARSVFVSGAEILNDLDVEARKKLLEMLQKNEKQPAHKD
jgi:hypothetical protein